MLCSGTLPRATPFRLRLEAAVAAGYAAVSLWGRDYAAARERGTATRTSWPCWLTTASSWPSSTPPGGGHREQPPFSIPPELDPIDVFRFDERELLRIGELVGARSLNAADVLGGSWGVEEGAAAFAALCDRAADHGLLVHLEWLAWSRIADLATAWEVVRLADRDNGGLNVDTWHCARTGTTVEDLRAVPGERVLAIQLDDGPADAEHDLVEATLHRRLLPGEGEFDLAGYLGALRDIGAAAPTGVEVFSDDLHSLGPMEAATRSAAATRHLLGTLPDDADHPGVER